MKIIISAEEFENLFKQAKPFLALAKKNRANLSITVERSANDPTTGQAVFQSDFMSKKSKNDAYGGGQHGFVSVLPCKVVG